MINAKVINTKLTDVNFKFHVDNKENITLEIKTESTIMPPKDNNDNTAMYVIKGDIHTPNSDEISIQAVANIILEFDQIPKDYNELGNGICLTLAQKELFNKIDEIVEIMGYPKFNINVE